MYDILCVCVCVCVCVSYNNILKDFGFFLEEFLLKIIFLHGEIFEVP